MNIETLIKQELRSTLRPGDSNDDTWIATLIPINLMSQSDWQSIHDELCRLASIGYIERLIEVDGQGHDDDDVLYPVLSRAGLAWLETH